MVLLSLESVTETTSVKLPFAYRLCSEAMHIKFIEYDGGAARRINTNKCFAANKLIP